MREEDISFALCRVVAVRKGWGRRFFHLLVPHCRLLFSPLLPLGGRTIPRRSSHWAPLSVSFFFALFFFVLPPDAETLWYVYGYPPMPHGEIVGQSRCTSVLPVSRRRHAKPFSPSPLKDLCFTGRACGAPGKVKMMGVFFLVIIDVNTSFFLNDRARLSLFY